MRSDLRELPEQKTSDKSAVWRKHAGLQQTLLHHGRNCMLCNPGCNWRDPEGITELVCALLNAGWSASPMCILPGRRHIDRQILCEAFFEACVHMLWNTRHICIHIIIISSYHIPNTKHMHICLHMCIYMYIYIYKKNKLLVSHHINAC